MENNENKVIQFPKKNIVREIPNEQIKTVVKRKNEKFVEFASNEIAELLGMEFDNMGIIIDPDTYTKDFVLLVEAVRSLLMRQLGFSHKFQSFADKHIRDAIIEMPSGLDNVPMEVLHERIQASVEATMEALKTEYAKPTKKRSRKKKSVEKVLDENIIP